MISVEWIKSAIDDTILYFRSFFLTFSHPTHRRFTTYLGMCRVCHFNLDWVIQEVTSIGYRIMFPNHQLFVTSQNFRAPKCNVPVPHVHTLLFRRIRQASNIDRHLGLRSESVIPCRNLPTILNLSLHYLPDEFIVVK